MRALPKPPRRPVALMLMVIAPILWSTAGVLTRQVDPSRPAELAFWRSFFCALFVGAVLFALRRGEAFATVRASGAAALLSGAMWGTMFTTFIIALTFTTTANVLLVCTLGPLFTALLARAVLREPVPARTWVAIVVAALGMAVIFGSGFTASEPRHLIGILLALTIPIAAAVNVVVLRKAGAHLDLLPSVLLGALFSLFATLPWALPAAASGRDIAVLAVLGMFQMGLPCMLLVVVARTLTAPEIALLGLLEVVLGPLWTWLWAGEQPALATLAGGAVVLAAIAGNELAALAVRKNPRFE
jgi:drug/metabolite transporter (DMT)-like permease